MSVGLLVDFRLHLSFMVAFDNKVQYKMLPFSIHINSPRLTKRLPHLPCVTRITICRLVNFTTFMINLQLFDYITL